MSERKHKVMLFKNNFNFTKSNVIILFRKLVVKQRENVPRYGKTINNSFLGTVCSTIFCANCLFKNILMYLSTKLVAKEFS